MAIVPIVTLNRYDGKTNLDLFSLLLEERIIMLSGEITQELATLIISEILYLSAQDEKSPITIYINSQGGSVHAGLAIYDIMKKVPNIIVTIGLGLCASMGAFLLSSGSKGHRFAMENTEIMIHQPLGGSQGQVSDLEIITKRYIFLKEKLNKILAHNTGQSIEKIVIDTDRDYFLSAEDAQKYHLIDEIIYSSKD